LFKLFLLICTWNTLEMRPLSIMTFFKYSLTQNKGQKKNVMNKIKFYCYHEVVLSRYCCWEVDMEEWSSLVHVKVSSSMTSIWKKKHICWIQLFT
jgi:hypothetical protein